MKYTRSIVFVLSSLLVWAGFSTTVAAAVVSTGDAHAMEQSATGTSMRLAEVRSLMARHDVQQAMVQLGVDPVEAELRVAALSDPELAQLQGQLEQLPAGGSLLGLIGAVFVVLLILEITGVIDIFKKV
ncbi:MAG: PA2779 family protein [Halieaceae bacterium]|jgi:hypothetical protein|nr:PA2779 family protein [Halieaceae bacterium]